LIPSVMTRTRRTLDLLTAVLAWSALLLQFALMQEQAHQVSHVWMTLRYFSYFTILSNFGVALACSLAWVGRDTHAGRFAARPAVRAALTLYILVTAGVYHLLLARLWRPQGMEVLADSLLHTTVPALYAGGWLLLAPVRTLRWRQTLYWLPFPGVYLAWALLLGVMLRVYPYPFIDLNRLDLAMVLRNAAALGLLFLALGALLIAWNRRPAWRRGLSATASEPQG